MCCNRLCCQNVETATQAVLKETFCFFCPPSPQLNWLLLLLLLQQHHHGISFQLSTRVHSPCSCSRRDNPKRTSASDFRFPPHLARSKTNAISGNWACEKSGFAPFASTTCQTEESKKWFQTNTGVLVTVFCSVESTQEAGDAYFVSRYQNMTHYTKAKLHTKKKKKKSRRTSSKLTTPTWSDASDWAKTRWTRWPGQTPAYRSTMFYLQWSAHWRWQQRAQISRSTRPLGQTSKVHPWATERRTASKRSRKGWLVGACMRVRSLRNDKRVEGNRLWTSAGTQKEDTEHVRFCLDS